MTAEFLTPDDHRWGEFLERVPHDIYQRPEYVRSAARHEGGTPTAFLAEADGSALLVPLVRRPLPPCLGAPETSCDAISPYGYPGILATGDARLLARCATAFRDAAHAAGIVTVFLRLNPFLAQPSEALDSLGLVERGGPVVYIDLTRTPDELWAQTRANHRTGIRKLQRDGFQVVMDDWERYQAFIDLYTITMQRVEATQYYFFPASYFADLRRELGDRLHLCTVVAPDGSVASAGIFFVTGGMVHYHLGGTAEAHLRHAPSKLMFHHVSRWAQERGERALHLGGGLGAMEDSLFNFKAGFSPLRAGFHTCRVVVDPERYASLVGPQEASELSGYFPAYRRQRS